MGWDFPGTNLRQGAIRISEEAPSGHPSSASRPFGTRGSRSERCKRAWFNVVYERGRKGSDEGRPRRFFGTSLAALFGLGNPKRVYRTRFGRLSPSSASKWRSPFGVALCQPAGSPRPERCDRGLSVRVALYTREAATTI